MVLDFLSSTEDLDTVKCLIELGADINLSIVRGSGQQLSPMQVALQKGNPEIVQYLIQHGAKN